MEAPTIAERVGPYEAAQEKFGLLEATLRTEETSGNHAVRYAMETTLALVPADERPGTTGAPHLRVIE